MTRPFQRVAGAAALTALLWLGAALPGLAGPDCARLMASFRVPAPGATVAGTQGMRLAGCSAAETTMFRANLDAARKAVPVQDPSRLYGTWLGDDVLDYVAGIAVPGQEVLVIGPGEGPGQIAFRQYWIKASVPAGPESLWDETGTYQGLLAEGVLDPQGDAPGRYGVQPFSDMPMIRYHHPVLEWERSANLGVWQRLNHFEQPLTFALAGEVLVAQTQKRSWPGREDTPALVTYTRVAEGAPELALLMVQVLELSQAKNFDCLTHQISEGQGPLVQALAPVTLEEVRANLLRQVALLIERKELMEQARNGGLTDEQRDRIPVVLDRMMGLSEAAPFTALRGTVRKGTVIGCYDFP
ncbi:hypothetical protein [Frigidibacter sp. ROC022]|uniref:hypothetical protein n=1 Tax=Frigidibacter sp. ROC022 TaxID=2971796 RepID=UPI00215AEE3A|nr:hypothetical protein [Frigidibacter sp. ROC022]MCR8725328.1 hypothetical protein [Frigidibacter sp. ROC022]